MKSSFEYWQNEEIRRAIDRAFDSVEVLGIEHSFGYGVVYTIKVSSSEIDVAEDKIICPTLYTFEGVEPFVIAFDD